MEWGGDRCGGGWVRGVGCGVFILITLGGSGWFVGYAGFGI